jgi:selenocysteine-specific elongation factor
VRSVEVHDRAVERAAAGQRVAVNLSGLRIDEVHRGDVLATPGLLRETRTLDCSLELRGAEHNGRVQVHHGTRVAPGRLAALDEDLWQVRLEHPLYASDGDRVVIRRPSPPDTLGGGVVLDARARRHGPRPEIIARLRALRDGEGEPVPTAVEPDSPGDRTRGTSTNSRPPVPAAELEAVEERLRAAGQRPLTPAQLEARPAVLRALRDAGTAVRVRGELYAHAEAVEEAQRRVIALIERDGAVTLAGLRDDLGISRKSAQALLEHFDSLHLTRRLPDDRRILSRRAAQARAD